MTEAEWLACGDPHRILGHLHRTQRPAPSDRKLRLLACACCRRVWPLLADPRSRRAVEVAERFADDQADPIELDEAQFLAHECHTGLFWGPYREAAEAADWAAWGDAGEAVELVSDAAARAAGWESAGANGEFLWREEYYRAVRREHCSLLRDLFPFRPVTVGPALVKWRDGTILAIARGIYEDRAFGDLPILADAIEDAGCEDPALLE